MWEKTSRKVVDIWVKTKTNPPSFPAPFVWSLFPILIQEHIKWIWEQYDDFMLRFCDIFSQNSALALKFALRMLALCPRTRLHTRVLPLALREFVLADLCSALGFFVDQSCQPIEAQLVLTNQTVPVCLRVRSLFFEERRIRAGTLSTGFIHSWPPVL